MVQLNQLATINVFSLDIYSPKTQVNVLFAYIDESNNFLGNSQIDIPINSEFTHYEISKDILENTTGVLISITPSEINCPVYIDNLQLINV